MPLHTYSSSLMVNDAAHPFSLIFDHLSEDVLFFLAESFSALQRLDAL